MTIQENSEANLQSTPEAVIFDLDGTIYLGERLIPGADRALTTLKEAGIRVVYLTNKPISSPDTYATKLKTLGIEATASDVITSVRLTVEHLVAHKPGANLFVIGEQYLRGALRAAGFNESEAPEDTDVVVVSLDRSLDYAKLHFAYQAARSGAHVVATNPDAICPLDGGEIIDAGAWIAGLEAILREPITDILGKPSPRCAEVALLTLGVEAGNAMVVGDRMETDIRMAIENGMQSALVLSGVTDEADIAKHGFRPDYVLASVSDLPNRLGLA